MLQPSLVGAGGDPRGDRAAPCHEERAPRREREEGLGRASEYSALLRIGGTSRNTFAAPQRLAGCFAATRATAS